MQKDIIPNILNKYEKPYCLMKFVYNGTDLLWYDDRILYLIIPYYSTISSPKKLTKDGVKNITNSDVVVTFSVEENK